MKNRLFILLILLFLPIVNAATTFDLDFNLKENYPLIMAKGDRVLFEYGGYNHTIILDEIKKDVVELDVFLFLESGPHTPNYVYLNNKYNIRLDFDKEGDKEISIEYGDVDLQNQRAMITFRKLEAWDKNVRLTPFWESENVNEESNKGVNNKYIMGGIGLFILIILI